MLNKYATAVELLIHFQLCHLDEDVLHWIGGHTTQELVDFLK